MQMKVMMLDQITRIQGHLVVYSKTTYL